MKKRIVEYQGRKYRVVKGRCGQCPFFIGCTRSFRDAIDFCGGIDWCLRETLRSRLATWWRGWVKRNIIDDYPYPGEM